MITPKIRELQKYRKRMERAADAIESAMYPGDTLLVEDHTANMNLETFVELSGCDHVLFSFPTEEPVFDLMGLFNDSYVLKQYQVDGRPARGAEVDDMFRTFDMTTVVVTLESFVELVRRQATPDDFIVDIGQPCFLLHTDFLDNSIELDEMDTLGTMRLSPPAWLVLQSSGMFGFGRLRQDGCIEGLGVGTLTAQAMARIAAESKSDSAETEYERFFGSLYTPQTSQLFLMHMGRRFKRISERFETIEVRKSILSRVSNAQLSIPRELFLASSYLEKGTRFMFKNLDKYNEEIALSLWVENDILCMAHEPIGQAPQGGLKAVSVKTMKVEALPERITSTDIRRMFSFGRKREKVRNKAEFKEVFETMGLEPSSLSGAAADFENYLAAESVGIYLDPTEGTTNYDKELPNQLELATKLICALNSPEMRGSLKTVKVSTGVDPKTVRKALRHKVPKMRVERKLVWGTDRVQYIYPGGRKRKGNTAARYVRPHLCRFYIKDYDKYAVYDPVGPDDNSRYSIIKERRGHWTGKVPPDVTYSLGREPSNYSRMAINWLNKISKMENVEIQHAENGGELRVELGNGRYYLLDGYCEETNTAYEFNGDVWHGNPECFSPEATPHPHSDVTARELHESQMEKERILSEMGFNVVSIWERDYRRGALA